MPVPRFRLRTLMIAVAVAGMMLGVGLEVDRLWGVSAARSRSAVFCRLSGAMARHHARSYDKLAKEWRTEHRTREAIAVLERKAASLRRDAAYWALKRSNYERAARYPWLPVPPDPPMPK